MVADPNVSVIILELVVADHVIAIAHHLKDEHVLSLRQHEGSLLAGRSVKGMIQVVAILVNNLVCGTVWR